MTLARNQPAPPAPTRRARALQFGAVFLIGPCFLAAAIFHPNLNKDWVSDVSWTFSMYVAVGVARRGRAPRDLFRAVVVRPSG
jgi:hypothetical protein